MRFVAPLLMAICINMAMFIIAFRRQTDKLTDVSYAITFVTLVIYGLSAYGAGVPQWIVGAMVTVWAVRLGSFLLFRIRRTGRDSRFDAMRQSAVAFGKFWLLQGVSVWVIMLAASALLASKDTAFTAWSYVGIAVWLCGLVIESVADWQKYQFSSTPGMRDRWIDQGLWRFSRHPNYAGEMLVWIGVYLSAVPYLDGWSLLIGAASPVYICCLLLFVSGVPILEKSADERWGDQTEYQAYKRRTGVILPRHTM